MSDVHAHYAAKHALITGGSAGIGLELARRLVDLDAAVTLVARGEGPLADAAAKLTEHRPNAQVATLPLDVADETAVGELVPGEIDERPLDILINCAGIAKPSEFVAAESSDLRAQMEINYFGALWMTRAVVPHFLERGAGQLVNMGSTASLIGVYGYAAYCPPKFALYGLSEVLRAELAPRGIGVSIVLPGSTRTRMLERELAEAPPPTRRILTSNKVLSTEAVADAALRGVARGRFEIIPGLDNRLSTRAYRAAPAIGRAILDREVRRGAGEGS
jgi:3-dehydrosphinganine reductase